MLKTVPAAAAPLHAGLEALDSPLLVLDEAGRVAYATRAAARLLGADPGGRGWAALWTSIGDGGAEPGPEARRATLWLGGGPVPVRVWRRPTQAGALVGLEDLRAEDEREREVLRIFQDAQEQADDLFALYQITQFLNTAQELDGLCASFLRELTRLTSAQAACLYLAAPDGGLHPQVWTGLDATPPPAPDEETAAAWFTAAGGQAASALPLVADEQLVGLALLAPGASPGRAGRFLRTVGKEMGTALLVMAGRQALRAGEQKLAAIVNATTDAIIGVGPDGQVRDFNPAAETLTGYRAAEARDRSCAEVLGCLGTGGCGGVCPFAEVLTTRAAMPYVELLVGGRAGAHPVAASLAPLDLGGEAPAAVAILRDMTRPKQVEQMKSDFLATVSHQLRTPLALLQGYSETLLHLDLAPHEQRACITGIGEATARLTALVTQVLDVTRIQEGRMALHHERVRLVDVVRGAINALPAGAVRARIWSELAPDLPPLHADPQRLEQVLINLLDNALKYSPPTGQVIIRAAALGGRVRLQVLDEGIGIPSDEQANLFTRFYRASNARRRQVPGSGLGLFICRSIIEAHGGRILLASAPGAGTCVTCWLLPAEE